ncbi:hypothetical protein D3C87_1478270 [compost metagenome]
MMRATVMAGKRVAARAFKVEYARSRAGMPCITLRRLPRVRSTSARLVSICGQSASAARAT